MISDRIGEAYLLHWSASLTKLDAGPGVKGLGRHDHKGGNIVKYHPRAGEHGSFHFL